MCWLYPPPSPTTSPACILPRSKRQRIFAISAVMLLVLQTIYCTFFVAAFSLVVADKNCSYPWTTLSILDFFQVS